MPQSLPCRQSTQGGGEEAGGEGVSGAGGRDDGDPGRGFEDTRCRGGRWAPVAGREGRKATMDPPSATTSTTSGASRGPVAVTIVVAPRLVRGSAAFVDPASAEMLDSGKRHTQ
ncbi:hypothetical protein ALMP_75470 [Streptomyces sp. A012304]|nr:hypothetical protein ALMP_75470 [Streptomyces sp. A012304]